MQQVTGFSFEMCAPCVHVRVDIAEEVKNAKGVREATDAIIEHALRLVDAVIVVREIEDLFPPGALIRR